MKKEVVIEEFGRTLPFKFNDVELLRKVFVHRSYLNEKESIRLKTLESNERLEFLGDAVLSNIISHMLFNKYPDIDEGELTKIRSRLVNRHTLSGLAKGLGLDRYMLLGKGERASGGAGNPTILAGAFEALIAAMYFELGFKMVFSYIETMYAPLLDVSAVEPGHFDYKPRLQEVTQRVFKEPPRYRLIREEGPPHKRTFEVEVIITGEVFGRGSASKKKDAEQSAAASALKELENRYGGVFPERG
ncbi:MAG: ribonuclease III [Deltaproteobacteria bacterium]|nr:ribonuclease III [Deltaproteobacteria bacterium]